MKTSFILSLLILGCVILISSCEQVDRRGHRHGGTTTTITEQTTTRRPAYRVGTGPESYDRVTTAQSTSSVRRY